MITLPITRDDPVIDRPGDLRALAWMAAKASSQGGHDLVVTVRGLAHDLSIGQGASQSLLRRLNRQGYIDIEPGRGRAPSTVTVRTTRRRS
jgi:MarR-like DNA-binding transcriptional regulator SgrR of sgrS sRNA